MREYEIRRGHYPNIEGGKLETMINGLFGSVGKNPDGSLQTSYGAMKELKVWLRDKTSIAVEVVSDPKVDDATASETIKRYNAFLEQATGFNSKERAKRLQKKAKEGKP